MAVNYKAVPKRNIIDIIRKYKEENPGVVTKAQENVWEKEKFHEAKHALLHLFEALRIKLTKEFEKTP